MLTKQTVHDFVPAGARVNAWTDADPASRQSGDYVDITLAVGNLVCGVRFFGRPTKEEVVSGVADMAAAWARAGRTR